jgi:hypothetical protein
MGTHGGGGQVQANAGGAFAPGAAVAQLKMPDVGNEIGFPGAIGDDLVALATVIPVAAAEAVQERERVSQHEVEIAKAVDHRRRVGHGNEARRRGALYVEVLMPGVKRPSRHAFGPPIF